MILIAFRHGLRASELCSLQWPDVEFESGTLHLRRAKGGATATHPLLGDELRALRPLMSLKFCLGNDRDASRLQREVLCGNRAVIVQNHG